ncbi:MAG: hypothetical protein HYT80_11565 [Euryarchaeota archaeon]|nr:hypothetical protein [Euryarchaeota archaeon]
MSVEPSWAAEAVSSATKHMGFVSAVRKLRNPSLADLGIALVKQRVFGSKLPPSKYLVLQELLYELTRNPDFIGDLERLVGQPATRETVAFALWWKEHRLPRGGGRNDG